MSIRVRGFKQERDEGECVTSAWLECGALGWVRLVARGGEHLTAEELAETFREGVAAWGGTPLAVHWREATDVSTEVFVDDVCVGRPDVSRGA